MSGVVDASGHADSTLTDWYLTSMTAVKVYLPPGPVALPNLR